jgi:hypothetical protein
LACKLASDAKRGNVRNWSEVKRLSKAPQSDDSQCGGTLEPVAHFRAIQKA